MHRRTLSWGLYRGQHVQTRLAERVYADAREKNQHDQQNREEIPPGELLRSGTCNPIIVDISKKLHVGHGRRVHGSGENDSVNLFASSFLQKDKNPLTPRRISKYNASQEIRNGTPESSDVITGEVI